MSAHGSRVRPLVREPSSSVDRGIAALRVGSSCHAGRIVESLATVNSLLRTGLATLAVGLVSLPARTTDIASTTRMTWQFRRRDRAVGHGPQRTAGQGRFAGTTAACSWRSKDEEIADLHVTVREKEEKIQKLDTALRLLKVNHRVAWLTVVDQETDPETNELFTTGRFVEVNDKGEPLGAPREFRVRGDVVYIDNWVVKFDDDYVERAEIDRSTSLGAVPQDLSASRRHPNDGIPLDPVGSRPQAYGSGGVISDFEKRIWEDFWTIANDEVQGARTGDPRGAWGGSVDEAAEGEVVQDSAASVGRFVDHAPMRGLRPMVGKPAA
jgi:hypothetical protein